MARVVRGQIGALADGFYNLLSGQPRERYCDVVFVVSETRIPCIRGCVAAISNPLNAMLYGGMREASLDEVIIESPHPPEVFAALFNFCMFQRCEVDDRNLIVLLTLAEQYLIQSLKTAVENAIRELLLEEETPSDMILDVLESCVVLHASDELKVTCVDELVKRCEGNEERVLSACRARIDDMTADVFSCLLEGLLRRDPKLSSLAIARRLATWKLLEDHQFEECSRLAIKFVDFSSVSEANLGLVRDFEIVHHRYITACLVYRLSSQGPSRKNAREELMSHFPEDSRTFRSLASGWIDNIPTKCAICREPMADGCIECAAVGTPAENCKVSFGACSHAYHAHCIGRWLRRRPGCPLCNTPWEVQDIGSIVEGRLRIEED